MDIPPLITNVKTPQVFWYQNGVSVIIRIILADIENYFVRVDYVSLRFSTRRNGCNYYLWLNLFGSIIPQQTIQKNKGREIQIKLAKAHKWTPWLRLQRERTSNSMIKVDLEHVNDTEDENTSLNRNFNVKEYNLMPKNRDFIRVMPDIPSSDDDESEDEIKDALFL